MIKNKKLDNLIELLSESVSKLASSKNKIKKFQKWRIGGCRHGESTSVCENHSLWGY